MIPVLLWALGFLISSALLVRVVRAVAVRRALLDVPNERSSHKVPVPRLGGAAFVPLLLGALGFWADAARVPEALRWAVVGGAAAMYVVSLLDDVFTLSTGIRFAVQFAAAGAVLAAAGQAWPAGATATWPWTLLQPPGIGYWILCFWIVGLLNIYNFMDGIDGIAGSQAVVAGLGWWWIGTQQGVPFAAGAGLAAAAVAAGFLTQNWPPAKIFMGDAGSTVLGFLFAVLPFVAVREAGATIAFERWWLAGALMVWPFWADGAFTILRRLRAGENILKAHRSHLYQRLVIAGHPHVRVTVVYAGLAAVGAGLAPAIVAGSVPALAVAAVGVPAAFAGLWFWTGRAERAAAERQASRGAT